MVKWVGIINEVRGKDIGGDVDEILTFLGFDLLGDDWIHIFHSPLNSVSIKRELI